MKTSDSPVNVDTIADRLYRDQRHKQCVETDRTLAVLMIVQWLVGIVVAVTVSPHTWIGDASTVHIHVWAAVLLGALLAIVPVALAVLYPGQVITRHVIAVAQMLWSALLIHLSGGRIETHFHVFGSLAYMAFYRDWKVLLTATVVVAADHMFRGLVFPLSVLGVIDAGPYRWIEHAGWVVFEDLILFGACFRGIRETREISYRRAELESTNSQIESEVEKRTSELRSANEQLAGEINERCEAEAREAQLGRIIEGSLNEIYIFDSLSLQFRDVNRGARENVGYSLDELQSMTPLDLTPDIDKESFQERIQPLIDRTSSIVQFETRHRRKDGSFYEVAVNLQLSSCGTDSHVVAMIRDITDFKRTEVEFARLQQEHLESARHAGMAEIATGVLHNVGNVLNSVNVSTNLLSDRLMVGRIDNLQKALAMLEEHSDDPGAFLTHDEKGRRLPAYLRRLSDSLFADREFMQTEVELLSEKIEHIKQVVQAQQSVSCLRGHTELVDLSKLVDTALTVNNASLGRHEIEIQREFDDVPPIRTDRHQVLQILINLISNAKNLINEFDGDDRRITIRIRQDDDETSRIEIQDTGSGISSENLNRVFGHGFTTRRDGHGFGLHSSANAAGEMGGSLTAFSEGTGLGATFTLLLPIEKDAACHKS